MLAEHGQVQGQLTLTLGTNVMLSQYDVICYVSQYDVMVKETHMRHLLYEIKVRGKC